MSTDIIEAQPDLAITISQQHASTVIQNVETLTANFKTWMEENTDYTRELYGHSKKPSLLDPGAHKLTSFFQSYPDTHIIDHVENREPGKERIKYVVRADIIHVSGTRIGSGVGSCTTDETKYQYRWLTEYKLRDYGYSSKDLKTLPSQERKGGGGTYKVYRIRNPEILDLDNTILKMATKRAEVDAALSLPGVAGVFTQDIEQYPDALGVNDNQKPEKKPVRAKTGPPPRQQPRKTENTAKVKDPPSPEETAILDVFLDRDLRTHSLIIVKQNGSIWVQHPSDYPKEKVNKYGAALEDAGYEPVYHQDKNAWEIPQ